MTWIRPALLTLLVLCLGAAPAHATLLVRSDGNGLFVMDKNGLNDSVAIFAGVEFNGGPTVYRVRNANLSDVFKFDRQVGCGASSFGTDTSACDRNGPKINVQLSSGSDSLVMSTAPVGESSVAAGFGNDEVSGNAGKDQLHGQDGEDKLGGLAGNDTLVGGGDSDRLEGGDGDDTLQGEGGSDVLIGGLGTDVLSGSQGNDFVNSKEPVGTTAVADTVGCGSGTDFLEADLKDLKLNPVGCEEIDESPVGETPHVVLPRKVLSVSRSGVARVRLRCPRGVKKLGCKGSLRLRLAKSGGQASRSRKVRYGIKAGRRKTVALQLTAKDVSTLRQRQRRKLKTGGILTSVEKGKKGRKTTVRNPRLRLRGG